MIPTIPFLEDPLSIPDIGLAPKLVWLKPPACTWCGLCLCVLANRGSSQQCPAGDRNHMAEALPGGQQATVEREFSALLGRGVTRLRKTDETPARISVIDVAVAICGYDFRTASNVVGRICEIYEGVRTNIGAFKFPGRGQRPTPVTDARGAVELAFLLPGRHAARIRRKAADLLVRWLGGDCGIIAEVCALRGVQEELAACAPEDPLRIFGEDVEAGGVMSAPVRNLIEELAKKVALHIDKRLDEKFAAFAKPQRPRAGPCALADGNGKQPGTRAPVRVARARLEGLDRVLQGVVQRCKGKELTSTLVHGLVRNLRYTLDSGKRPSAVANDVLDRLIAGGLAEDVGLRKGATPGKKKRGRPVRVIRLKPFGAIKKLPSADALRKRPSLGQEDLP